MHPNKVNLLGTRYGRLIVIKEAPNGLGSNPVRWECLCDCGNTHIARRSDLQSGDTTSCGCYIKDNPSHFIHGQSQTHIYQVWKDMHYRCSSTHNKKYIRNYINRGITVCEEWSDLNTFTAWALSNGHQDHLSLDRIETLGGYTPDNCRWTSLTIQSRNRRKTENTSSQYIGVSYVKAKNRFMASVSVNNKNVFTKKFKTEIEAAQARDNYILTNKLEGYRMNF